MIAQIQQSKWQGCQLSSDYRGKDYTASLTLGKKSDNPVPIVVTEVF